MLSVQDINFLEKDYPQLRSQKERLVKQNKDLQGQVRFQALVIKLMALKLREVFASDIDINKVIMYYEKLVQNEMARDEKARIYGDRLLDE
jgi:hypothetical protein